MNRTRNISPASAHDAEAITRLALGVFRLNGALLDWGDQLVAPLGLTSARWQMLGAIALAEAPLTAPQIGEAMGVTRQGAQKQLNLLLEQGLVEARANPAHRRSPLHGLTPKGLALYRKADALWTEHAVRLGTKVPGSQAQTALKVLESMLREVRAAQDSGEEPS